MQFKRIFRRRDNNQNASFFCKCVGLIDCLDIVVSVFLDNWRICEGLLCWQNVKLYIDFVSSFCQSVLKVTENWDWRFTTMQVCPFFVSASEKFLKIRIEGLARCRNALAWIRRMEIEKNVLKLVPVEYRLIIFNDFVSFFCQCANFFGNFFYCHTWEKCLKIGNAELHRNASAWIKRLKKV